LCCITRSRILCWIRNCFILCWIRCCIILSLIVCCCILSCIRGCRIMCRICSSRILSSIGRLITSCCILCRILICSIRCSIRWCSILSRISICCILSWILSSRILSRVSNCRILLCLILSSRIVLSRILSLILESRILDWLCRHNRPRISIVLKYGPCAIDNKGIIILSFLRNIKRIYFLVNEPIKITLNDSNWCFSDIFSRTDWNSWSILSGIRRRRFRLNRLGNCVVLDYTASIVQYKVFFRYWVRYISTRYLSRDAPFKVRFYNFHRFHRLNWFSSGILGWSLICCRRIWFWWLYGFRLRRRIILDYCSRIV
jgi:hypothetical protein